MRRLFIALFLSFITLSVATAQTAAKSAYVELGGPGLASANFDSRFSAREDGLGGRVGFGAFSDGGITVISVPVGLNYLLGKDGKNYFEIGAGATYLNGTSVFDDSNSSASAVFGHLSFGYRLQPANGGFLFRAAIVPIFGNGFFIPYYAGIAFGYKF